MDKPTCQWCGIEMLLGKGWDTGTRQKKFCDRVCARRAADAERAQRYADERAQRACQQCGVLGVKRKWCAECRKARKLAQKREIAGPRWRAENPDYHRQWKAQNPGYREAYKEQERAQRKRWAAENRERVKKTNARWRDENPDYGVWWRAENIERCREYSARGTQKRRARKMELPSESVSRREIYERDRWVCGLCGKRVDKSVQYPNPLSASLDHIIPLALGGHHVAANVQLAHLGCNMRKHTQAMNEQLRLIG